MTFDIGRLRSFDFETPKFRAGELAPKIVCGSSARIFDGKIVSKIHVGQSARRELVEALESGDTIAFANAAYDLAVLAANDSSLMPLIIKALDEDRIYDILIAETLNAIALGTLGLDPNTGKELRSPSTGKTNKRYNLEIVTYLLTGRVDAKKNDVWRKSYGLLDGIPEEEWPYEAVVYPVDDAKNTLEDATIQIMGKNMPHDWIRVPGIPGFTEEKTVCRACGGELTFSWPASSDDTCPNAGRTSHKNLNNVATQT